MQPHRQRGAGRPAPLPAPHPVLLRSPHPKSKQEPAASPPEKEGKVLPVQAQRVLLHSRRHHRPARCRCHRVASGRGLGQRVVCIAGQHHLHRQRRQHLQTRGAAPAEAPAWLRLRAGCCPLPPTPLPMRWATGQAKLQAAGCCRPPRRPDLHPAAEAVCEELLVPLGQGGVAALVCHEDGGGHQHSPGQEGR